MNNTLQTGSNPVDQISNSLYRDVPTDFSNDYLKEYTVNPDGCALDPYSITGSAIQIPNLKVALGWITMSFFGESAQGVNDLISVVKDVYCRHTGDEMVDSTTPILGYEFTTITRLGTRFCFSSHLNYFTMSMSEQACRSMAIPVLMWMVKDLSSFPSRIVRFDLPVDDFTKVQSIKYISESKVNGEFVSRIKSVSYTTKIRGSKCIKSYEMCCIGERESDYYLRIYDKNLESKGKINSIRWELELKGKLADVSFHYLFRMAFPRVGIDGRFDTFCPSGFAKGVLMLLASKITFKDITTGTRTNTRKRSIWWDNFLAGLEAAKISIPDTVKTIDKTIEYVREQVSTSLSLLSTYFKDDFVDFVNGVLDYGRARLKKRHLIKLVSFLPVT